MINSLIGLLLINLIIVYCVDVSGFVDFVKRSIWSILYKGIPYTTWSLKPLDCSICLTFWIGLIYVGFSSLLGIALVCMISLLSPVTYNVLIGIRELLIRLSNYIK